MTDFYFYLALFLLLSGGVLIGIGATALLVCRRDRRDKAALWELIGNMTHVDQEYLHVHHILAKYGVEIPEDKVVG